MTPFWWVVLFIAFVLARVVYNEWRRRRDLEAAIYAAPEVDPKPDCPVSFGFKSLWLAFRTDDPESVVKALLMKETQQANWQSGIAAADHTGVYVTPALDGWVLAVSPSLPSLGSDDERWRRAVAPMARHFPELQYFATHRIVEYHAWARFRDGELVRAYAYLGESGETLTDFGALTDEEAELGLDFPSDPSDRDWEADDRSVPTERNVTDLAGLWSLDPTALDQREEEGVGWYGESPRLALR